MVIAIKVCKYSSKKRLKNLQPVEAKEVLYSSIHIKELQNNDYFLTFFFNLQKIPFFYARVVLFATIFFVSCFHCFKPCLHQAFN